MLKLILVDDQNIAFWAIAAMFIDCCRIVWLDVDEEGHFANQHFPLTIRAGGKSYIRVWFRDEPVHW
jgi:hypothetical protein